MHLIEAVREWLQSLPWATLAQLAFATLITIIVANVRRIVFPRQYVPIHLVFSPFPWIDKRIAQAYGLDAYGDFTRESKIEKEKLHKQVRQTALFATLISSLVIPYASGYLCSLFVPGAAAWMVVVAVSIYKVVVTIQMWSRNQWLPSAEGLSIKAWFFINFIHVAVFAVVMLNGLSDGYATTTSFESVLKHFKGGGWAVLTMIFGSILQQMGINQLYDPHYTVDHRAEYESEDPMATESLEKPPLDASGLDLQREVESNHPSGDS